MFHKILKDHFSGLDWRTKDECSEFQENSIFESNLASANYIENQLKFLTPETSDRK
jgi:hypothetical protein